MLSARNLAKKPGNDIMLADSHSDQFCFLLLLLRSSLKGQAKAKYLCITRTLRDTITWIIKHDQRGWSFIPSSSKQDWKKPLILSGLYFVTPGISVQHRAQLLQHGFSHCTPLGFFTFPLSRNDQRYRIEWIEAKTFTIRSTQDIAKRLHVGVGNWVDTTAIANHWSARYKSFKTNFQVLTLIFRNIWDL